MADANGTPLTPDDPLSAARTRTLDEARAMARDRFKERVRQGEKIGNCDCHTTEVVAEKGDGPVAQVAGVRFRDSGRMYYFNAEAVTIDSGDWVVVDTNRGREAGRVIVAPHQLRLNRLQGSLRPIVRRLEDSDVAYMESLKGDAARAVKTFGAVARDRNLPIKPISAEYNFDGSCLTLNYATNDKVDLQSLVHSLADQFGCRVELRQVGPRDEARLLGGLGKCGRTLCCSSWLPVFPEVSMGMAKTQELGLNPGKVSGVCGRLLCCLSYENEQYKQMKAVLPRLGQNVETPSGAGMVISLQVLRELVTVRLAADNTEIILKAADMGFGKVLEAEPPSPVEEVSTILQSGEPTITSGEPWEGTERRCRRRRRGDGSRQSARGPVA
ncbi:MAG: hypothetical protein H0T49_00610 [Chloroflexia bacterium]|nr:hypothetical protein [Chloroflexia bacterium]